MITSLEMMELVALLLFSLWLLYCLFWLVALPLVGIARLHCEQSPRGCMVNSLEIGCHCIYRYLLRAPIELLQELPRRIWEGLVGFRYVAVVYTHTLPYVTYLPYYALPRKVIPVYNLLAPIKINGKCVALFYC